MFSENTIKSGCIEVICGSMFSGKTEELIRRLKRAQFANQKIAIFKPTIDNRYSDVDVVSHDLHSITSTPIDAPVKMLGIADDVQVVGIDEAQFFDDSIVEVAQTLANHSHRLSASTKLVELGEKDVYEPLCRQCYIAARAEEKNRL